MTNDDRADLGLDMVREAAENTNVWVVEDAHTSLTDCGAYLLHVCNLLGLDPRQEVENWMQSYEGDAEDGPYADKRYDPEVPFAEQV